MPRDAASPPPAEIDLPGNRRGRLVPADNAGEFRVQLVGATWVDRLAGLGWLNADQVDAAATLRELFERSGVRPRVCGGYQGPVDAASLEFFLECLDERETAAWRRLSKLLAAVPPDCRTVVDDVALWDKPPNDVRQLQRGLAAVARATRLPRRDR